MKLFRNNAYLMILLITINLLLLYPVTMQETPPSEEWHLLNYCLTFHNKTEEKLHDISEKMKDIKFNIIIKVKYRNLIEKKNILEKEINEMKEKMGKKNYDKNEIIQELNKLKNSIIKFDEKCDKFINVYNKNEELKNVFINMIKVFFITIFIVIIIALAIIGIVSFFVIKRQRRYYKLEEEITHIDQLEEGKKYNNELIQIKNKRNNQIRNISEENKNNFQSSDRKQMKEETKETDQIENNIAVKDNNIENPKENI